MSDEASEQKIEKVYGMENSVIDYDAPEVDPSAFVTMIHPELEKPATGWPQVSLDAFETVWYDKGWKLQSSAPVDPDTEAPVPVPQNAEQADELGVDHAEIQTTETAPSHLAVVDAENPTEGDEVADEPGDGEAGSETQNPKASSTKEKK